MDGWGHGRQDASNAIFLAKTPFLDLLYQKYYWSELTTHSESVGLPAGQMGNSEVGHLNLGAGRVVYQDLQRINKSIADNNLQNRPALQEAFRYLRESGAALHLMGLVSDGGVHSHINHLKALLTIAASEGIKNVFV